ncbi:MAG: hypothetical protein V1822_01920, partial [Candidatus Micrarchaeota archaeon]
LDGANANHYARLSSEISSLIKSAKPILVGYEGNGQEEPPQTLNKRQIKRLERLKEYIEGLKSRSSETNAADNS